MENCLEVIFEAEKELAVSGGDFEFGRGSGDNVRGGGRNVEGNVSMKEFLESCLEVIFEAEKELAVSGGDFDFGRGLDVLEEDIE